MTSPFRDRLTSRPISEDASAMVQHADPADAEQTARGLTATAGARHRHLELLERAIAAIHEERRPDRALQTAVRLVADHNGWRTGYVYRARGRPPVASPTTIWHDERAKTEPALRRTVQELHRTTGKALATRVLESQQPIWLDDVEPQPALVPMREHGLEVLAMFPVMTSLRPVAVLEFLSAHAVRPEEEFFLVMRVVGIQLGYLIERANLERRIARLAVQEQQRIARELHDTVGQEAAAIGMLTRMLHQDLERRGAAETDLAGRLLEEVQQMKFRIRDFVSELRPIEIEPGELRVTMEEMAERYARLGNCTCTVHMDDDILIGDAFAATKIARIAREAIHNAVKHGDPSRIAVSLRRSGQGAVTLEIVDDGTGADVEAVASGGLGQQIMRYRADLLSADLDIDAAATGGVRVRCVIPDESLEPDEEEEAET